MSFCSKTLLSFLLLFPVALLAQIFPKEGSHLHYRLIGFSFPYKSNAGKCVLQIAKGNNVTASNFKKSIIKSIECKSGNIVAEVPAFGCDYTWTVNYERGVNSNNELHHFSTMMSPKVDTAIKQVRIASEAKQYKGAYFFLDCTQVLYDMKGNPVWFLPDSGFSINSTTNVRDVKLSPQGTITFMTDYEVYEINYDGTLLWKGPNTGAVSGQATELYHHEFTRLENGHYMVLGGENPLWKVADGIMPDTTDNDIVTGTDGALYQKMNFGTVIEYDEQGKVTWSWKSADYFKGSDLYNNGRPDGESDIKDVHENSFWFDRQSGAVYASFRNISRIVKVKYPEDTVIAAYGITKQMRMQGKENDLFCGQHSVGKTHDGYLYLYNNNALAENDFPKLVLMQEPANNSDSLEKVWEYTCTLDGLSDRERNAYDHYNDHRSGRQMKKRSAMLKLRLTSGGSLSELPDKSLFCSMNGPFSKTFIINRDKEIIWNAVPEQRQSKDSLWNAMPTYRASIIPDRKDIERMIWNSNASELRIGSGDNR